MQVKLNGKSNAVEQVSKRRYGRTWSLISVASVFVSVLIFILINVLRPLKATEDKPAKTDSARVIKVGIIQQLEHPSLDQVREYFVKDLEKYLKKHNATLELDLQNAQNDISNCQTIAVQFANKNLDLVMSLGTAASQAVAKEIKDKPIIAAAVTDPLSAKLLKSLDKPGVNLTAVSDLSSMEEQVKLIKAWKPDVKKVGLLYSSSEANSIQQIDMMKIELDKDKIEYSDYTFSNSSELNSLLETAMQSADIIYIPTDNTVAASMALVHKMELQYKVPVIVAAQGMLEEGGLSCVGIDYRKLGSEAAKIADQVLNEGQNISEIPVKYLEDLDVMYREDTMKSLGLELPSDLKDKAEAVK